MNERKRVTEMTAGRYRLGRKKEKGIILDEFTALTGYGRSYARMLLRNCGRIVGLGGGVRVRGSTRKRARREAVRYYDEPVAKALATVWRIMDYICGKRLGPVLGEMTELLVRQGELKCTSETREKLAKMSAATIDRLLRPERKKYQLKGRSHTKPGTLLKHQIPIRTFSEWDDGSPGFLEIDLVGHDGGTIDSLHAFTLDAIDVATGWVSLAALKNKAQVWTFEELKRIRARLPFPLLGIDSDNGSEFINEILLRYCREEQITFTRSRPYRKNDGCFVEQKNYSVVRRSVGWQRFEGDQQVRLLNELYESLELYTNFFQPSMKLKSKQRDGARVKKTYDTARTPFRRVLESESVAPEIKRRLKRQFESLNPARLKRRIEHLQRKLSQTALACQRKRKLLTQRPQRPVVEMPSPQENTKKQRFPAETWKSRAKNTRLYHIPTTPAAGSLKKK